MVKLNNDLFNGPGANGFTISADTSVPTFTKQDASYKFLGNDMTYHQYKKTAFSYTWIIIVLLILFMIAVVFIIVFVFRTSPSYPNGSLYETTALENGNRSGFYNGLNGENIDPLVQKGFVNVGEANNSPYLINTGQGFMCVSEILSNDYCSQLNPSLFPNLELVGSLVSYQPSTDFMVLNSQSDPNGKAILPTATEITTHMTESGAKSFIIDYTANKIYFYITIDIQNIIIIPASNLVLGPYLYFTKDEFTGIFNNQYIMIAWASLTPQTIYDYITGNNNVKLLSENLSLNIPKNLQVNIIFNDAQVVTITEGSQSSQILTSPYFFTPLTSEASISWDPSP